MNQIDKILEKHFPFLKNEENFEYKNLQQHIKLKMNAIPMTSTRWQEK